MNINKAAKPCDGKSYCMKYRSKIITCDTLKEITDRIYKRIVLCAKNDK